MKLLRRLTAVLAAAACLTFAGHAQAALMYDLSGFSSDEGLPLSALVVLAPLSPNELKVSVTNQSHDAGPSNRITFFGIQIPNDVVTAAIVAAETHGTWSIQTDGKLPGGGAPTFEFLHSSGVAGNQGLKLGETLTVLYTAQSPIFNNLDPSDWTPTTKGDYLMAAKWQSIGINHSEDSGTGGKLTVIPEPATAGLLGIPALLLLMRRRRRIA